MAVDEQRLRAALSSARRVGRCRRQARTAVAPTAAAGAALPRGDEEPDRLDGSIGWHRTSTYAGDPPHEMPNPPFTAGSRSPTGSGRSAGRRRQTMNGRVGTPSSLAQAHRRCTSAGRVARIRFSRWASSGSIPACTLDQRASEAVPTRSARTAGALPPLGTSTGWRRAWPSVLDLPRRAVESDA